MSSRRVVFDTSVWVALLQDEADRAEHVERLLLQAERGDIQVMVSALTITEITKGPMATDSPLTPVQERKFSDFIDSPFVTMVSVDPKVAERARDLRRGVPRLKTPDAIVVATALVVGAAALYSYDADDHHSLVGSGLVDGLEIAIPPVDHQLDLSLPGQGTETVTNLAIDTESQEDD
jgi:predicted nucleic acid-binding protein